MRFSIVIPAYNAANYISRCLDSLIMQDYPSEDFEIIVVDDCSVDDTCAKVYSYIAEYQRAMSPYVCNRKTEGSCLKLIQHVKNKRQGGARNTGIRAAQGEWIMFLDADDYWVYKNTLSSFSKLINTYSNCNAIRSLSWSNVTDKFVVPEYLDSSIEATVIDGKVLFMQPDFNYSVCTGAYRKHFILENSIFFEENMFFEDTAWNTKLMSCIGNLAIMKFPFYGYYVTPSSTTRGHSFEAFSDNARSCIEVLKVVESTIDKQFKSVGYVRILGTLLALPRQACYFPIWQSLKVIRPLLCNDNLFSDLTKLHKCQKAKLLLIRHVPMLILAAYKCASVIHRILKR